jgi:sigma-E factor negative regulatory protein RseA
MQHEIQTQLNAQQKAQISDLADGLLHGQAFADAMVLLNTSSQASQARAEWRSLHLVGDVMRTEELATVSNSAKDNAFLDKFRANLALESSLTAPMTPAVGAANTVSKSEPANEPFFSWKWAAGLSAIAAAVVLGLNLVSTTAISPANTGGQLAQSTVQISTDGVTTQTAVMLRNPQLDAFLAAHSQAGGSSALQMPSGFLRSATFNTPSNSTGR